MERKLILNRIQTPDGTMLTSYHRHDFVCHYDKDGTRYCIDGGNEYQRITGIFDNIQDKSVYSDAPFEEIREAYHRANRGVNGDQPLKWVSLKNMSDKWLKNTIVYHTVNPPADEFYADLYIREREYRKEHKVTVDERDLF